MYIGKSASFPKDFRRPFGLQTVVGPLFSKSVCSAQTRLQGTILYEAIAYIRDTSSYA